MQLVRWVNYPSNPLELFEILKAIRDDELVVAADKIGGNTGRIAWAEIARRRGYFEFDVAVSQGVNGLELSFSATAPPIHDLPQYS